MKSCQYRRYQLWGRGFFDRVDSTEEFQAMFSVRGKALYTKMDFLFK